jgi:hypothetical protein
MKKITCNGCKKMVDKNTKRIDELIESGGKQIRNS